MGLYPVKARDRLVESISSCIKQMSAMEGVIAAGVENPVKVHDLHSPRLISRFNRAKHKAQNGLDAAETFLPFCLAEPRLKGTFRSLEPIYREIIYVLRQIIDRMDNAMSLRLAYGSSVLEELNPLVFAHRRSAAASVTLTLFAVNEALTTKLPLPQYLPSCRLAQIRVVNRVREVVLSKPGLVSEAAAAARAGHAKRNRGSVNPSQIDDDDAALRATQQKFLSWNAAAGAQMEIVEFLEELVDLTKLLVGVNAFRSGMLDRLSYRTYMQRLQKREKVVPLTTPREGDTLGDGDSSSLASFGPRLVNRVQTGFADLVRRRQTLGKLAGSRLRTEVPAGDETQTTPDAGLQVQPPPVVPMHELPPSLRRVGTRMMQERNIARRATIAVPKGRNITGGSVQ
jgi:hypothetical protein